LPHHKRQLNELIRRVKSELDAFRIKSYEQYVSNIHPSDSNMWQATKRILNTRSVIPTLNQGGLTYESDLQKCELLADYFETAFQPNDDIDHVDAVIVRETLDANYLTAELPIRFASQSELKTIIKRLPQRKSPGPDLIPNIVLKHLTNKAVSYFTSIINACLSKSYFPLVWKHAVISVVHKPNKPNSSPSSYRPISLLSTLSKVFEKIILKRMLWHIDSANIIPPHQFGFRPKHSTVHQILRIYETVVQGFEQKKHTVAAFLDIAQAFDKVWHGGLIFKLINFGFPMFIINIIKSFISQRTFSVRINSTISANRPINAGVPQGSILGPVLFNLYMSDIPIPEEASLALYADDTVILCQDSDIHEASNTLQTSIDVLIDWFYQWKFKLNTTKCETKIFSLRKHMLPHEIQIDGTFLPWNPNDQAVKYLGIWLDKKLNWNFHVNKKLTQGYARLAKLYPIINRRSTLKPKCTVMIYKTIIRPLVMYASSVWGLSISRNKIKKIQVFQNKVLRIAVNAPWFIRNKHLHEELGVQSVIEFIKKSSQGFINSIDQVPGAITFNIGQVSVNRRLKVKARLPQDFLIEIDD
jgi:hypothetical protein